MTASTLPRTCELPNLTRPDRVATARIAPEDSVVGWDEVPPHAATSFMVGLRPTLQSDFTPPDHAIASRIAPEETVKLEKVCRLCRKRRRGAAVVEFALVAPLFFLLVFGMIEFGRMVMVQQVITNASREGARLAVLDGETGSNVQTAVDTYLSNARVTGATVTIQTINKDVPTEWVTIAEPSTVGYGESVKVVVAIPFNKVSWLPSPMFIGGNTQLTAGTVMRRETVR